MNSSNIFILIAILALGIIALLAYIVDPTHKSRKISPLTGLSFAFVIAGIFFGAERWLGYSLIAVSIILAIADIIFKYKKSKSFD